MGRNTGRGKVAYSWISPDPAKVGPTPGVVVVVELSRQSIDWIFDYLTTSVSLELMNKAYSSHDTRSSLIRQIKNLGF